MILDVMDKINNHFLKSVEVKSFEIVADGIIGDFSETYFPDMYVLIKNSYRNNGLYKITTVEDTKLTVEETLKPEVSDDNIFLYACSPPDNFLSIVSDIESYNATTNGGVKSKTTQDLQVVYNGDDSWYNVFKSQLKQYRKVYSDLGSYTNRLFNCQKIDCSHF